MCYKSYGLECMSKKNSVLSQEQLDVLWLQFQKKNNLSDIQLRQFQTYAHLLVEWNKKFNITAITDMRSIIEFHFQDSLSICSFVNLSQIRGIADVGTGGGFPGIPIKIMAPDVFTVLIEVNQKKVQFLHEVIRRLELHSIEVSSLDWRTFLRQTAYPIDLVCARASLSIGELVRMFKAESPYADMQLVYWASRHYSPETKHEKYVYRQESYVLDGAERRLFFFKKNEQE